MRRCWKGDRMRWRRGIRSAGGVIGRLLLGGRGAGGRSSLERDDQRTFESSRTRKGSKYHRSLFSAISSPRRVPSQSFRSISLLALSAPLRASRSNRQPRLPMAQYLQPVAVLHGSAPARSKFHSRTLQYSRPSRCQRMSSPFWPIALH